MDSPSPEQLSLLVSPKSVSSSRSDELPASDAPSNHEAVHEATSALPLPPLSLSLSDSLSGEAIDAPATPPADAAPVSKPVEAKELAPMLQQYRGMKQKYPEHLLLFQVGDFYEIFFEDAPRAADALKIRLTSRSKDEAGAIPMCGVPIHALENYLPRLLQAGHSVVIVSQVEESKNKKGMVQREITRIVTPGVRFEGDGLDEKRFNYLAALVVGPRGSGALAFADVSTGWLRLQEFEGPDELAEVLRKVRPAELILPSLKEGVAVDRHEPWLRESRGLAEELASRLVFRPFERVTREAVKQKVQALLIAPDEMGDSFQRLSMEALQVLGALLQYVEEVSFGTVPRLSQFSTEEPTKVVLLDAATRRNLELTEARIDGDKRNSLVSHVDYTKTAMGSRLLAEWILGPSADREEIEQKHNTVEELLNARDERITFREAFVSVRDIDRLVSRVTGMRAVPRDLGSLRDSLAAFPSVAAPLSRLTSKVATKLRKEFDALEDIFERLASALVSDPPMRVNEGGIFQVGFHPEVDRLRGIGSEGHQWLAQLEQRERAATGISSLKVKFNNVFGYFIEITKVHLEKVPKHYERRQTLVNAERFIIPELKEYEASLLSAKARQFELERELFIELRKWICDQAARIQLSARCLAALDVYCAFAHLAETHSFTRPEMLDEAVSQIHEGRHPVIERVLGFHRFIPNDTLLDTKDRRFAVLTGPNMGGKSTYLRQVGLIQLLAQAGSFVPAASARLGVVDRIFTRIGAADDLARGDSTFMVEMREASTIVRKASVRSLVLIDEIGRGTATRDGLALATAIAEWLHDVIGCRTLFATHFHELTDLAEHKAGAFCLSVGVVESGLDIEFTHRIEERAASRSYGIEVARLAGLPEPLLERAQAILVAEPTKVERVAVTRSKGEKSKETVTAVLAPEFTPRSIELEKISQRLEQLQPEAMTPLQALMALNEMKQLMKGEER